MNRPRRAKPLDEELPHLVVVRPEDLRATQGHVAPRPLGAVAVDGESEDVVVLHVEDPLRRQVLRDERPVDVLRPLGLAGRPRGVVEDRRRPGLRREDVVLLDPGQGVEVERDLALAEQRPAGVDDGDEAQVGEQCPCPADLREVLALGEDAAGPGVEEAGRERLLAEARVRFVTGAYPGLTLSRPNAK